MRLAAALAVLGGVLTSIVTAAVQIEKRPEFAAPEAPNPKAPDAQEEAAVDEWISRLSSPSYIQRTTAEVRLIEMGDSVTSRLRTAYHRTDDYEQRLRIEQIVMRAYMNRHLYDRTSFLGIRFNMGYYPSSLDFKEIPEGQRGILIMGTEPGSAAHQAGIDGEDIILAIDGTPLVKLEGPSIGESFGEQIRLRPPGTPVMLTLLRSAIADSGMRYYYAMDLQVVLRRRPIHSYRGATNASQWVSQTESAFHEWWAGYFVSPDQQPEDASETPPAAESEFP